MKKNIKQRLFKYLFFVIVLSYYYQSQSLAQSPAFDNLLKKYASNYVLTEQLKNFAKQGLELDLDVGKITPEQLIANAKTYLGTPHCIGGLSYECIDCSGLLYMIFKNLGIIVPHNSQEIARYGKLIIEPDSLKQGDLVFFIGTYKTSKLITHVGIYLEDGKFIHTSSKKGVIISDINDPYYWSKHFIFGKRIFHKN